MLQHFFYSKEMLMSMHLVGPALTTTRYNSKKKKATNKRLLEAQARHEEWLKSRGLDSKSLAEKLPKNKKGKRIGINEIPNYSVESNVKLSNTVAGNGAAKEQKVYSGERKLLGIAAMHKSNLVPIFADKKQDAKDIAQMRRN
jgi:hypothetical protein